MHDKIRWGVIGSGGIARRRTIPEGIVAASNAELAAVWDLDAQVNATVAATFRAQPAASLDALLKLDLDAVYIATPADCHREQALACASAGKHVLCEKPLGLSVQDATDMAAACQKAGVRLGTAFMMRFQSQHRAALELVRQGRLGRLVFGRAQLSCWYPPMAGAWRQDPARGGGGSLMDMGGHCIDLLEMFFGRPTSVSCCANRTVHGYAPEDSAVALLTFASGATAVVDTFFCIPDNASRNSLELYGSLGSIIAHGTVGQGDRGEMVAYLTDSDTGYNAQQARSGAEGLPINPPAANIYRGEIEEFSKAILENREPANNAQLGVDSQRILAACYLSARSGKRVPLD